MTVAFLLFAFVALFAVWVLRRPPAPPPPKAPPGAAAAPRPAAVAVPAAGEAPPLPELRPLLQRLYAVELGLEDADTLRRPPEGVHAEVLAAAGTTLEQLRIHPEYLPRRPQLLPQLMRTVNDPEATQREIAGIIGQDPALAASLLRIANSALYRPRGETVDSLERAVALVGSDGVRRIVVAALMQPVLALEGGLFARLSAAIWDYALRAASAASQHASRHGSDEDALSAQLLGLLQGLGAVLVMRVLQEEYARRPQLPPDLAVAAALLDRYTALTARTVTTGWELPAHLLEALEDQLPERDTAPPASALGAALRYGRLAAVLTVLVRQGVEQEAQALALLSALEPDPAANRQLWERLGAHPASEAGAR